MLTSVVKTQGDVVQTQHDTQQELQQLARSQQDTQQELRHMQQELQQLARGQQQLARGQQQLARSQQQLARSQDDFWENFAHAVKSALDIAKSLVEGAVHEALLQRIMGALVRLRVVPVGASCDTALTVLSEGAHKDTPTLRLISKLSKVRLDSLDALIECKSCGVALAVYASNTAAYDDALDAVSAAGQIAKLLPMTEVEFDVRGRVEVVGNNCAIACGEIKNSGSRMGGATKQLLLRCRLLRWTVQTLDPRVSTVVLIGRIFAPRRAIRQSGHAVSEMVDGVSIYKHSI